MASAVLFGLAAVAQATATRRMATSAEAFGAYVSAGLRDPLTLLVVATYLVGFVLHAAAIWLLPLYLAQGTISLSMPITALAAAVVLGEPLGARRWTAIGAVSLGVLLLGLSSGAPGDPVTTWGFTSMIWAGLALTLTLGLLARHSSRGLWVGATAGLGYAGSAIAVRGVGADLTPQVIAAACAVPLLGLVAFWLYSLSMTLADVTSATSALVVAQTFVPAVIGVTLLGDRVREGWAPAVITGLVLAVGGALAL